MPSRQGRKRLQHLRRYLPWLSLLLSIGSAMLMERKPERAPLVAFAAGVGWAIVSGATVFAALLVHRHRHKRRNAAPQAVRLLRLLRLFGMQSLTQLCVVFSLPFYFSAASPLAGHIAFVALLSATGVVCFWDPFYKRALEHPFLRSIVQIIAAFSALNCALPMVGLSNRASLYTSAAIAAMGSPLLAQLSKRLLSTPQKELIFGILAIALVPLLFLVGASSAIPPAPLRLEHAAFGEAIDNRELVKAIAHFEHAPAQLICFTSIWAPRGLSDTLLHVWEHEGETTDRIRLDVSGGRKTGFRTWSRKKNLGNDPRGKWTCTVETATGQVLGRTKTIISAEH